MVPAPAHAACHPRPRVAAGGRHASPHGAPPYAGCDGSSWNQVGTARDYSGVLRRLQQRRRRPPQALAWAACSGRSGPVCRTAALTGWCSAPCCAAPARWLRAAGRCGNGEAKALLQQLGPLGVVHAPHWRCQLGLAAANRVGGDVGRPLVLPSTGTGQIATIEFRAPGLTGCFDCAGRNGEGCRLCGAVRLCGVDAAGQPAAGAVPGGDGRHARAGRRGLLPRLRAHGPARQRVPRADAGRAGRRPGRDAVAEQGACCAGVRRGPAKCCYRLGAGVRTRHDPHAPHVRGCSPPSRWCTRT